VVLQLYAIFYASDDDDDDIYDDIDMHYTLLRKLFKINLFLIYLPEQSISLTEDYQ